MDQMAIDLGVMGKAPPAGGGGGNILNSSAWRTLLRQSTALTHRGEDGRQALNALRPCIDSPNANIRAHATLRKDEWVQFDEAVTPAYLETLVGVDDLLSRGLRINIANPFGTTVLESDKVSEMTEASVSMMAGTPPTDDRVDYTPWGVPVPIISKGFTLDERVLEASRSRGQTLDTTNADAATRVVAEKMEQLLFSGGLTYAGYTLGGYTNAAGVNTGSLSGSWLTLSTSEPKAILDDVLSMMQVLFNDNANGPFMVYVPHTWMVSLNNDYFSTVAASPAVVTGMGTPSQTILDRILRIPGVEGVKSTRQLTAGVVMVSMTRQAVDVGFGFEPRLVQWDSQGGMVNHFRVIAIMTFRCKSSHSGQSGIAYFT